MRQIWVSSAQVAIMTFITSLILALRDLYVAYLFGTSDQVDAFLTAYLLPSFLLNLINGALTTSVLPHFIEVHGHKHDDRAERERIRSLLGETLFFTVAILGVISVLLFFLKTSIIQAIAGSFSANKLNQTYHIFSILLVCIVLSGFSGALRALLHARKKFILSAALPAAVALISILSLKLFQAELGMTSIAIGLVGAYFLELIVLSGAVIKEGYFSWPRFRGLQPVHIDIAKQFAPLAASALTMNATTLITQALAANHSSAGISEINYGGKLTSFFNGIIGTAMMTVLFTHFGELNKRKQHKELRQLVKSSSGWASAIGLPVTLLLFIFSEPIIRLLFFRGQFSEQDVQTVSEIQRYFALQIPWYLMGLVAVRVLNVWGRAHTIFYVSIGNVLVCLVASWFLLQIFGLPGLAASTSLVYVFSCIALFYFVRKEMPNK